MQVAAYNAADEHDPVAAKIGAINTLVRAEDGRLKGYNTDWSAAIGAIEAELSQMGPDCDADGCSLDFDDMSNTSEASVAAGPESSAESPSPLEGKTVVVIGAGGTGQAIAYGAAAKGAKVILTNRRVIPA